MHVMIEETDTKHRQDLLNQLTGRFRTMGEPVSEDELNAPAWWHGEEEAYESVMARVGGLPRRR